jgi:hypothetical protein
MFVLNVELSRVTQGVRGSVLGTIPGEHVFSLTRGECRTEESGEGVEKS